MQDIRMKSTKFNAQSIHEQVQLHCTPIKVEVAD